MHLKIPPMLLAAIVAVMMFVTEKAITFPPALSFSFPYQKLIVGLLILTGVTIAGLGVASFRRQSTTVNPTRPSTASSLVVQGVYRFTRNPMYLGVLLLLFAWGIYLATLPVLLFWPAVFVIYMNHFQIGPEEQALTELFGVDYEAYKKQVRRWG